MASSLILAIGDRLIAGYGLARADGFAARLVRRARSTYLGAQGTDAVRRRTARGHGRSTRRACPEIHRWCGPTVHPDARAIARIVDAVMPAVGMLPSMPADAR